jgi:hypothetical protein
MWPVSAVSMARFSTGLRAGALRGLGPTLAAECLHSDHGFMRSLEMLRQWMIRDDLWVAKRTRRKRVWRRKSALAEKWGPLLPR